MTKDFYKQAFDSALKQLSDLTDKRTDLDSQRDAIDLEIAQFREGVLGLAKLCDADPLTTHPDLFPELISPDVGLTDAIRRVLQANGSYLSPIGVRTGLRTMGYNLEKYKNVLPSIHTVLRRLEEAGEVQTKDIEGKTMYKAVKGTPVPDQRPHYPNPPSFLREMALKSLKKKD